MVTDRLISLLLTAALVACPALCRTGSCAQCVPEQTKAEACPHCQSNQNGATDNSPPAPIPQGPRKPCELGNCLCAGAVMSDGGLDLQIGHVLGVFATVDTLVAQARPAMLSQLDQEFAAAGLSERSLSGRSLRLRIESLLI